MLIGGMIPLQASQQHSSKLSQSSANLIRSSELIRFIREHDIRWGLIATMLYMLGHAWTQGKQVCCLTTYVQSMNEFKILVTMPQYQPQYCLLKLRCASATLQMRSVGKKWPPGWELLRRFVSALISINATSSWRSRLSRWSTQENILTFWRFQAQRGEPYLINTHLV